MRNKNIYANTAEFFIYILFRIKYRFELKNKMPHTTNGIVLIGNHTSFIDWAFLQFGAQQKIHFFIEKEIYEKPFLKPFLSFFGALPIDSKNVKDSFKKGLEILNNGGIVAIFPEGELTKNGEISEFKRGFEFLAQKSDADVIPFYLHGLYGSRFSKKPDFLFKRRSVSLVFGNVLKNADTALARKAVMELRFKLI